MSNNPAPISYSVRIDVDPDDLIPEGGSVGNFVYQPALLRVQPGDQVTWKSGSPFVLEFKEGTPVEDMQLYGTQVDDEFVSGPHTIADGSKGRYHYGVAVFQSGRVFMDSGCPWILVN